MMTMKTTAIVLMRSSSTKLIFEWNIFEKLVYVCKYHHSVSDDDDSSDEEFFD